MGRLSALNHSVHSATMSIASLHLIKPPFVSYQLTLQLKRVMPLFSPDLLNQGEMTQNRDVQGIWLGVSDTHSESCKHKIDQRTCTRLYFFLSAAKVARNRNEVTVCL